MRKDALWGDTHPKITFHESGKKSGTGKDKHGSWVVLTVAEEVGVNLLRDGAVLLHIRLQARLQRLGPLMKGRPVVHRLREYRA